MIYEILSGLWICNKDDINKKFLNDKNITLIINCSKEINVNNNYNIEEIKIPLVHYNENNSIDKLNFIFYDYIFDTIEFIHNNKLNKNILIYSSYNNQRAISVLIAYIINYSQIVPLEVILFIKSKCNNILIPKPVYLSSFEKIYEKTKNKKT